MDAPFPPAMMPCIEDFFTNIHPILTPGKDLYPEVFQTSLFFPLQRQRELEYMIVQARELHPKVVMEIGADKGGGLYHWCQCLSSVKRVVACEIRGTPYKGLFEKAFPHIDFCWIEGSSYDPNNVFTISSWLGMGTTEQDRIDTLFIDGDKGAFRKDFDTYLPMMRHPSIVFMHDINADRPQEYDDVHTPRGAFESLRYSYKGFNCQEYINREESAQAARRERNGIPVDVPHEGWLRYWKGRSCGVGIIKIGIK